MHSESDGDCMEIYYRYMSLLIDALKREFTVYGFTFSFWQILFFVIVGSLAAGFIKGLND